MVSEILVHGLLAPLIVGPWQDRNIMLDRQGRATAELTAAGRRERNVWGQDLFAFQGTLPVPTSWTGPHPLTATLPWTHPWVRPLMRWESSSSTLLSGLHLWASLHCGWSFDTWVLGKHFIIKQWHSPFLFSKKIFFILASFLLGNYWVHMPP